MLTCKHLYVKYIGRQQSSEKDGFLRLYNCLICGSTITLDNLSQNVIITNKEEIKNEET